jgi:hypothetical protein
MSGWNAIGYLASGLVLAAFCMKEMVPLRVVAVFSNVAFLIYGLALGLAPVWLLHAALLPINCWRLWEGISQHLFGGAASLSCRVSQRSPGDCCGADKAVKWALPAVDVVDGHRRLVRPAVMTAAGER